MSQFSSSPLNLFSTVTPWAPEAVLEKFTSMGGVGATSTASVQWPSGSVAILVPFFLTDLIIIENVFWVNGATVRGNVDLGIYSQDGTRLFSTGPQLQSGTSVIQVQDVPSWELTSGLYYMGLSLSSSGTIFSASATLANVGLFRTVGCAQAQQAHPLPAQPTLIPCSQDFLPFFGICTKAIV